MILNQILCRYHFTIEQPLDVELIQLQILSCSQVLPEQQRLCTSNDIPVKYSLEFIQLHQRWFLSTNDNGDDDDLAERSQVQPGDACTGLSTMESYCQPTYLENNAGTNRLCSFCSRARSSATYVSNTDILHRFISQEYLFNIKVLVGDQELPAHYTKLELDINTASSGPNVWLGVQHQNSNCPRPIQYLQWFSDLETAQRQGYEVAGPNINVKLGNGLSRWYLGIKRVPAVALQHFTGSAIQAIRWSTVENQDQDGSWIRLPQNLNQHLLPTRPLFLEYQLRDLGSFRCANAPASSSTSNTSALKRQCWMSANQLAIGNWNTKYELEMPNIISMIKRNAQHVLRYEQSNLQDLARAVIPQERLQQHAAAKSTTLPLAESILRELLQWFKQDFFTWMDAPNCRVCHTPTTISVGVDVPTSDEERRGQASRVELYRCTTCSGETRFPRYNHPAKLLETRTGRCGEWANCFTLCCRAMGFEARYVLDVTDHVWTEVYSEHYHGWIHCDACENQMNLPLTYERGWGKELSYIFAFSKDEVVDVMRYVDLMILFVFISV